MTLDIAGARSFRPYTTLEYFGRLAWVLVSPLFRYSPRPLYAWRNVLLRSFGARIGAGVHIYPSVRIIIPWNLHVGEQASVGDDVLIYNLGMVTIGARASVSHKAHLCAGSHDYEDPRLPLLRLPITIQEDAWVCAQAFVGPGVTIASGAVVGAGAVLTASVEPWTVVAGNPARPVKMRRMVEGAPT